MNSLIVISKTLKILEKTKNTNFFEKGIVFAVWATPA